jgi:hypothetical protein
MIQDRPRRTILLAVLLIAAVVAQAPLAAGTPLVADDSAQPAPATQGVPVAAINASTIEREILRSLEPADDDRFGYSVAMDGQTAVIGVPYDDGPTNATPDAGAVHVYVLAEDGRWTQQAILRSATPDNTDFFGGSVAIDGDTIVVGADYDDGASNSVTNAGAAYVFVRTGGGWTQQTVLRADDPDPDDLFGGDVDISGDTVVVGAMQDDGLSDSLANAGQAYVFARTNGTWSLIKYLDLFNPAPGDAFGKSVAIDGDRIAVGAFRDDGPGNDKIDSGSVTIFKRTTGWSREQQINSAGGMSMEANDHFGGDVDISGTTLVVGAFGDAGPNNNLTEAGAAYVYQYIPGVDVWSYVTILRAAQPTTDEYFGGVVAIDGDLIVVGAFGDDGASDSSSDSGATYLFTRQNNQWVAETTLRASNASAFDWFGESVAVAGGHILVGASLEDGSRNTFDNSGAVYLFFRTARTIYIPLIQS